MSQHTRQDAPTAPGPSVGARPSTGHPHPKPARRPHALRSLSVFIRRCAPPACLLGGGALLIACASVAPEQTASQTPPERPTVQTRRCQIQSNGAHERRAEWSGPCEFAAEATSSDNFSVTGADRAELLPGVLSVSVHVLDSGEAEVRGLTTQGINSRWGDAIPDPDNASCWKGSDFRVCVQPNHPQEE